MQEKKHQLRQIAQILETVYGLPQPEKNLDPLDELISTILSQSTTNINSARTFASLRQKFPHWEMVRKARPATIARAIQSGGLANVKAVVIKNILQEISTRLGNLDLSWLKKTAPSEALEFLLTLKGVGPKTARCVLLFACQQQVFPMDTHIFRILQRLALLPRNLNDEKAHAYLTPLIPTHKHLSLHINLIEHGRKICHSRQPKCERCCLLEYCNAGQQQDFRAQF